MSNSKTESVKEKLDRLGVDPLRVMAQIATGELLCGICHGKGRTKFQRPLKGKFTVRTCEHCNGSGDDRITPELRAKVVRELAQYISPAALVGPATERMRQLLKSGSDAVAIEAAKAILDRAGVPVSMGYVV